METAMLILSCCGNLASAQTLLACADSAALDAGTRAATLRPTRREAAAIAPNFYLPHSSVPWPALASRCDCLADRFGGFELLMHVLYCDGLPLVGQYLCHAQ